MTLQRFGAGSDFGPDALVVFENFGFALYIAQVFERDLQVAMSGLERLKLLTPPPHIRRSADGIVDDCLGPMLKVLEAETLIDPKISRFLRTAQVCRNELVHRFMAESVLDMLNAAGRRAVNDRLYKLFSTVFRAQNVASQLRDQVWARLGLPREQVDQQIKEWLRLSDAPQAGRDKKA
jgi:hypothetical protein